MIVVTRPDHVPIRFSNEFPKFLCRAELDDANDADNSYEEISVFDTPGISDLGLQSYDLCTCRISSLIGTRHHYSIIQ